MCRGSVIDRMARLAPFAPEALSSITDRTARLSFACDKSSFLDPLLVTGN